jgi:hypothetical protein
VSANQICNELLSLGWREYPDQFRPQSRFFAKRYPTPTRCHCNDDKAGAQIELHVSEWRGGESMELQITAGLADGTWVKLQNYGLPKDVHSVIALIPRLLATWEAIAKPTPSTTQEQP